MKSPAFVDLEIRHLEERREELRAELADLDDRIEALYREQLPHDVSDLPFECPACGAAMDATCERCAELPL